MDDLALMYVALQLAASSPDEVPVGAVIACGGEIVATAHNEQFVQKDSLAHAEMLVIHRAQHALGQDRLGECTLFVTLEPCPMCAGAIMLSGLKRCVFAAFDRQYGCCGSVYALPMDPVFHHRTLCEGGLLEEESKILLNNFFQSKRQG